MMMSLMTPLWRRGKHLVSNLNHLAKIVASFIARAILPFYSLSSGLYLILLLCYQWTYCINTRGHWERILYVEARSKCIWLSYNLKLLCPIAVILTFHISGKKRTSSIIALSLVSRVLYKWRANNQNFYSRKCSYYIVYLFFWSIGLFQIFLNCYLSAITSNIILKLLIGMLW